MSDIVVINLENATTLLRRFPDRAMEAFRKAADASMLLLVAEMAVYPPPPPNSTYRRTGLLGRSWNTRRTEYDVAPGVFRATLRNPTPYGVYVQGERQARVHRNRWTTVRDAATRRRAQIEAYFAAAVRHLEREVER